MLKMKARFIATDLQNVTEYSVHFCVSVAIFQYLLWGAFLFFRIINPQEFLYNHK